MVLLFSVVSLLAHQTRNAPWSILFFFMDSWRELLTSLAHRWVPKVKDGLTFGMEHPEIVELEEERWTLHESILKVKDGDFKPVGRARQKCFVP